MSHEIRFRQLSEHESAASHEPGLNLQQASTTTKFSLVVACDANRGIGFQNGLPWRLPGDLKYFRELTSGAAGKNAVIMGRKTWESIPFKFRPLPKRLNIVLTRDESYELAQGVIRCSSLDEAASVAQASGSEQIYVTGGSQVYADAMAHPRCERIYVTQVLSVFECDVFFPSYEERFQLSSQSETHEDNGITYRFQIYEKKA